MLCPNMTEIPDPRYPKNKERKLYVDCKKCIPCKINKTSEWSMRCMMELEYWDSARFITLTYKPGTTPDNKTLVKEDLQAFWKALRQNLDGRPIKYFSCGEYGEGREMPGAIPGTDEWEKGKRPHYHAIVFGLNSSLEDRMAVYDAWKKAEEFQWFGKNWQKACGTVTPDSCSYTAGYCQKKLFGKLAEAEYTDTGRIAPFQAQSLGIGERYFLKNYKQIVDDGYILFRGVRHPIPECWKRKYEIDLQPQKDAMFEEKKAEYLAKHKDITEKEYMWFFHRFGFTMDYDDMQNILNHQAFNDYIIARNNLTRRKTL